MRTYKKKIFNIMEEVVEDNLNSIIESGKIDFCTCDKCLNDIAAITLNNLRPKYVSTSEGAVIARIEKLKDQLNVDIYEKLVLAIETVKKNPHH